MTMKKIININLSGRVIPIEDSAYEKLQGYIESLRKYFAREEGREEIINDIESRIAELMNEKIRKGEAASTPPQDFRDEIVKDNLKINNPPTLAKCTYIVRLRTNIKLHNGISPVPTQEALPQLFYYEG